MLTIVDGSRRLCGAPDRDVKYGDAVTAKKSYPDIFQKGAAISGKPDDVEMAPDTIAAGYQGSRIDDGRPMIVGGTAAMAALDQMRGQRASTAQMQSPLSPPLRGGDFRSVAG